MKKTITLASLIAMTGLATAATTLTWEGGTNTWGSANWNDGANSGQNHPDYSSGGLDTVINTGSVTGATGANLTFTDNDTMTIDGGSLSGVYLKVASTNSQIILTSGSLIMSDNNSFRTTGSFKGDLNFNGTAGAFTLTQTNNSTSGKTLANKVSNPGLGLFSIDSTQISIATAYNGSNMATINAELAAQVVGGRYFEISEDLGTQSLYLVAVPEPSSTALLGLGGIALILRRRK